MTNTDDFNLTTRDKCQTENSYFNGDKISNIFFTASLLILRIISLDLLSPIVICLRLKWRAEHIYLNGRRLVFCGQIRDLFKKNTLWVFLSIITIGIFIPFKEIQMKKWEIAHTHFVGVPQENYKIEKSEFKCSWYKYAGISILKFIVTVFSLGFGYFWAYNFKEKVLTKCKFIDGHNLEFDATSVDFFLKKLLWAVLSIVTLGIYALFVKGKMFRWQIANTSVTAPQSILFDSEVAEKQPIQTVNKKAYISFFLIFPTLLFIICAWLSRVLCRHRINNIIIIVPYVFAALTIICSIALFVLSLKAYKNSFQIKSGKYLSAILAVMSIVIIVICIAIFVYLIVLTV